MKHLLLFITYFLNFSLCDSPAFLWNESIDGSRSWGSAIITSIDNNLIITGRLPADSYPESDMFLAKYSPEGSLLWNYTYPTGTGGHAILQLLSGDILVAGYENLDPNIWASGDARLWSIDQMGNQNWVIPMGSGGANGILQLSDGNILTIQNEDYYPDSLSASGIMRKFNTVGTQLWEQSLSSVIFQMHTRIIEMSNNDILIVGTTISGGADVVVVRLNSEGIEIDRWIFGDPAVDEHGASFIGAGPDEYVILSSLNYDSRLWAFKFDFSPIPVWEWEHYTGRNQPGATISNCIDGGFIISAGDTLNGLG